MRMVSRSSTANSWPDLGVSSSRLLHPIYERHGESFMKLITAVAVFFAVAVASLILVFRHAQGTQGGATDPNKPLRPVVVELFTSEGCSSCPPADALLATLDQQQRLGNAEIIALEE